MPDIILQGLQSIKWAHPPKHKSNPEAKPVTHDFNLNSSDMGLCYISMQGKLQTRATKPIIPQ